MQEVLKIDFNENNHGTSEKMYAHLNKELHKAFSVFIHDGNGNMLIQKRSSDKYHSGGLWTNACCSHPLTDDIHLEAQFRMQQELGFSCDIEFVDKFAD